MRLRMAIVTGCGFVGAIACGGDGGATAGPDPVPIPAGRWTSSGALSSSAVWTISVSGSTVTGIRTAPGRIPGSFESLPVTGTWNPPVLSISVHPTTGYFQELRFRGEHFRNGDLVNVNRFDGECTDFVRPGLNLGQGQGACTLVRDP